MAKATLRDDVVMSDVASNLRARAATYREKGYGHLAIDLEREASDVESLARPTPAPARRTDAAAVTRSRAHATRTPAPSRSGALPLLRSKDYPPCPSSLDTVPSLYRPEHDPTYRTRVSIVQACRVAGVSRRTIYNWIAKRQVDYVRTAGGAIRIFEDSLFRKDS